MGVGAECGHCKLTVLQPLTPAPSRSFSPPPPPPPQECINLNFPQLAGPHGAALLKRRVLFAKLNQALEFYNRMLLPAFIHRLRRCSPADVQALRTCMAALGCADHTEPQQFPPGVPPFVRQSMVLNALIQLSEGLYFGGSHPSMSRVKDMDRTAMFSTGAASTLFYESVLILFSESAYYGTPALAVCRCRLAVN